VTIISRPFLGLLEWVTAERDMKLLGKVSHRVVNNDSDAEWWPEEAHCLPFYSTAHDADGITVVYKCPSSLRPK